jgi:multiple sugar transport system substrate-binding protein
MMAVNKKALQYLPKGADVNNLTYDQVVAWGQSIKKATGERMFGLPAAPGTQASLIHRFLQGYAYPSYTGTDLFACALSCRRSRIVHRERRPWDPANVGFENW